MLNNVSPEPPLFTDFVRLLQWRAEHQGQQLAFNFMDGRELVGHPISYATLDRRARAIAAALLERGLRGERAVLLFQPGVDYIFALVACWYAGVTAVPVYAPRPNASYERIRLIVDNAQATAVLSTASVLAKLAAEQWPTLQQPGLHSVAVDTLGDDAAAAWRMPPVAADTLAVLQYTSGSTGVPKGVRLLQRHLVANSRMIARATACHAASVGVIWLPPYHDMGLIGGILQPLYAGFPMHLMAPATFLQRPLRWLEAISRFGGTISAAPNFAYELCISRATPDQIGALDLSSWQVAANGAEPVRADTMRRFCATFAPAGFNPLACLPCYGMAESTLLVSSSAHLTGMTCVAAKRDLLATGLLLPARDGALDSIGVDPVGLDPVGLDPVGLDPVRLDLVSSGAPDAELRVAIVDPYSGQACAPGQVGEIWISGATVADGYWARPEATAETFHARLADDPADWLRSGDLGALHEGQLYVTGRIKDLIVIRGHNHYPQDIEATALAAHPAIRPHGAAAFALDDGAVEGLGLVLELERNWQAADLVEAELQVRAALSREHQLQPARLVFVRANSIPKTSSGKIQRLLTRARLLGGSLVALDAGVAA